MSSGDLKAYHSEYLRAVEIAVNASAKAKTEYVDSNHVGTRVEMDLPPKDFDGLTEFVAFQEKCSKSDAELRLKAMIREAAETKLQKRTSRIKFYSVLSPIILVGLILAVILLGSISGYIFLAVLAVPLLIVLKNLRVIKAKRIWRERTDAYEALDKMSALFDK